MNASVLLRRLLCFPVLVGLVPAVVLGLSPPASSQTPSSLNLLKPLAESSAKVEVYSGDTREFVRGRPLDVTDSALVLDGRNGRTEVPAADVREVWSPGGPRYRKPVIVGSAIGLGLGLLAMTGDGDCNDPTSLCATDGPFTGGDVAIVTASARRVAWAGPGGSANRGTCSTCRPSRQPRRTRCPSLGSRNQSRNLPFR